jgi:hypothetical protein
MANQIAIAARFVGYPNTFNLVSNGNLRVVRLNCILRNMNEK